MILQSPQCDCSDQLVGWAVLVRRLPTARFRLRHRGARPTGAEPRLYRMLSALMLVGVAAVVTQPALGSTVDLAEIQGTVVPGGKEVRGVVEMGTMSCPIRRPTLHVACCVSIWMHAQVARHGLPLTPGRVWATPLRQRSRGATDRPRAHQLNTRARARTSMPSILYAPHSNESQQVVVYAGLLTNHKMRWMTRTYDFMIPMARQF